MNKSTRISGVDCKIGRKSRTGSTVTMSIPREIATACADYYDFVDSGEEPTGKIRRIELVMYDESDMEEIEKLQNTIEDLTEQLFALNNMDNALANSNEPLIEDIVIEQDEETETRTQQEQFDELDNLHLPANQRDLPLYGKKYDDDGNIIPKSQIL